MRFPNAKSAGAVRVERYTHGSRRGTGGSRGSFPRIILGGVAAITLCSAALSFVVGYLANVSPPAKGAPPAVAHEDNSVIANPRIAPSPPLASRTPADSLPLSATASAVRPFMPDTPTGRPDAGSVPPRARTTAAPVAIRVSSTELVMVPLERPATIASGMSEAARFHVQVGAFMDRPSAEVIVQRLRALGFAVRLVGDRPFLVWVGGYLDRTTAESLRMHLHAVGIDATLAPG